MTTTKDWNKFKAALPKSISLNGVKWTVRTKGQEGTDPDCFGDTDVTKRIVTVYEKAHRKNPDRGSPQATLFHELVHASLASTGIAGTLPAGIEEALVTSLEEGLFPHLKAGLFD